MTYVFNFSQHTPAAPAQKLSEDAVAFKKEVSERLGLKYNPSEEPQEVTENTSEANQSQTERALAIRSMIDDAIYEANEHKRFEHAVRKGLGLKAAF